MAMSKAEVSSLGGKARAKKQKEEAENKYYKAPNYCKYCGKIIEINGRKVSKIRAKKFCNNSCAAKYNNRLINKKKKDIVLFAV